ncbi:SurA N-terminal domain-containing protein [Streptomyces sp. TR06-5]|uniref:SurA N-terminal domain-containing protein n=1 Tax=Streptomyces sp. TR06-5 TaxID=3385976 RepID=UPI0039A2F44E
MHRRRSVVTVSSAAAVLLAAPLLTGCGGDTYPGSAAVVDGDAISLTQLQDRVVATRDAQREAQNGEQLISQTGRLPRTTLDGMIRHRIVERALADADASVSRREVQEQRDAYEQQTGGPKAFEDALLEQQGVAPSAAEDWVWLNVAVQKVADAWGVDPKTPKGNKTLNTRFAELSGEMDIVVNPRYGTWDTERSTLAPADTPWLKDVGAQQEIQQQG